LCATVKYIQNMSMDTQKFLSISITLPLYYALQHGYKFSTKENFLEHVMNGRHAAQTGVRQGCHVKMAHHNKDH